MEEYNLRVFVMVTHSPVGALPLSIVITSDETSSTLMQALDLLKACLNQSSFFGRGDALGPGIIMTDNCGELREALSYAWPSANLLLCVFHILQQVWRWLFDKNHCIEQSDRREILLLFKKALYEDTEEAMDRIFEEMLQTNMVSKYPNLIAYLETLYEYRNAWAVCYRSNLRIRGNNTNNTVESQFLVLKDDILNRTKEVNINGLIDKLLVDFMDHFKVKLLNVASGKFDGTYSPRFKGLAKKKGDGLGFYMPKQSSIADILEHTTKFNDMFMVCSFTDPSVTYTVDINIGICECKTGRDGSVCKHQYILWAHKQVKGLNFLPYLNAAERKEFAFLAIGKSMPVKEYYEGIHDRLNLNEKPTEEIETRENDTSNNLIDFEVNNQETTQRLNPVETISIEECRQEMWSTFRMLDDRLDLDLCRGILKFCERAKKFPKSRLNSAFHSFGTETKTSLKVTSTLSLKKAKRGKIFVQPEAVKRRKKTNGSKNRVIKGLNKRKNPFEIEASTKRRHKFSENVSSNEAVSKKAGRSMCSKTRIINSMSSNKAI